MRRFIALTGVLSIALALSGCPGDDGGGSATGGGGDDTTTPPTDSGGETTGGEDGGATGGEDAGTTGGEDVPPPSDPTCESYCAAVQAACGDEGSAASQFADEAACLAYCNDHSQIPLGTADDTASNTIGCRIYHAGVASGSDELAIEHCPHAGPSGGNVCGTWCENYCHLAQTNCTEGNELYADEAACMSACDDLVDDGEPGATAGDSVQCRIYHLGVAGSADAGGPDLHCAHGAPDGGGVCVDALPDPSCDEYCTAVMASCGADTTTAQYASYDDCMSYCDGWAKLPLGTAGDTEGNTVGCRTYHAGVAATSDDDAILHCPHAGPHGGGVCGSWCSVYCDLSAVNCTGGNELFSGADDCMSACSAYAEDGAGGDASGDSVQCRIYHLGVAGSDPAGGSAETHCPHADVDGGGVCADATPSCAEYCATVTSSCTGANAQYTDEQACLDYCEIWALLPAGQAGATEGNSIGCRTYHAGVAAGGPDDAATHCPHAGASGGNVCGSWCTNYCFLSGTNCIGEDAIFTSDDECLTECVNLDAGGPPGAVDGDSVQCRIYHLGVAGSDWPASAAVHCPHGALDGGGVCEAPPTCEDYCAAVNAACTGENEQYGSEAACLQYCQTSAQLPAGTSADTSGNTIGCRTYHAGVAMDDPATHCVHAGPSGGDVCGSWCENFCHLADTNCSGDSPLFGSGEACMTACGGFVSSADSGATEGDSVQCRIYHLGVAGSNKPDSLAVHCPHGAVDGGGICVDTTPSCEVYCGAVQAACGAEGTNSQYASDQACLDYCSTWAQLPLGEAGDTDGNSVGCRTYHAKVATTTDPGLHCAHAGPSGGNVCGSYCTNLCYLSETNCTGANAAYPTSDDCNVACALMSKGGNPGDTEGDSAQCRIYHLGVAGSDGDTSAAVHCPHGGADGGGICTGAVLKTGDTCDAPIVIGEVPYTHTSDSTLFADSYDSGLGCELEEAVGGGKLDVVYQLTPDVTGLYTLQLPGSVTAPTVIYVVTDCSDTGGSCVGYSGDLASIFADGTWEVSLEAGTTYFIILDGLYDGDEGPYQFDIGAPCESSCDGKVCGDDGCGGSCGDCAEGSACTATGQCVEEGSIPGNTCDNAFVVDALPFEKAGDTAAASPTYQFEVGDCAGETGIAAGAASNDHVYAFQPSEAGTYVISLVASDDFDPTLWVTTDCSAAGASCLGADDLIGEGTTEVLELTLDAGTTYFIIVDGYANNFNEAGAYTLKVEAPAPPAPTYDGEVQAIFAEKCSGCHDGAGLGGHNIANAYSEVAKDNGGGGACSGTTTVGECAVKRINNGSMPLGAPLTADQKATVQAWADAGFPEN